MPRQDGTGPEGNGPKTGRGLGPCNPGSRNSDNKPEKNSGFGEQRKNQK